MAKAVLKVSGMTCQHCVRSVQTALERHEGVRRADVDLQGARAAVEYDESAVTPAELAGIVASEGYEAEEVT